MRTPYPWTLILLLARSNTAYPTVQLPYATVIGTNNFTGVDSFLGIPFAKAGRFEKPLPITDQLGILNATSYGPQCIQGPSLTVPPEGLDEIGGILEALSVVMPDRPAPQSEDCLSINVQVPSGYDARNHGKLPVLFWIHGGGFSIGASALATPGSPLKEALYQGGYLVNRSVEMGQPIIFVSANYRLGVLGFLAGKEMTEAGVSNLGLQDQRAALHWVNEYISLFGGDPKKVTLIGESAGAISIATQMVMNDGDNERLFRGTMMFSGGSMKLVDSQTVGQPIFDQVASSTGCGNAKHKLECMKSVSTDVVKRAGEEFPGLFSCRATDVLWFPRPDGVTLKDSPHRLLRQGKVARIPYVIADVEDEGTLFAAFTQLNVTTKTHVRDFFSGFFKGGTSPEDLDALLDLYPEDPAAGSPYGTGNITFLGPQFKRLAAIIGDVTFQAGRRHLLNHAHGERSYTCLIQQDASRYDNLPSFGNVSALKALGSFHASDSGLNIFATLPPSVSANTLNIMSSIVAFTNCLDPNGQGLPNLSRWPAWNPKDKHMFKFAESGPSVVRDDFRAASLDMLNRNPDSFLT